MVLVDTTVWIDLLRGQDTAAVANLQQLLRDGRVATTPVVIQEILQGAQNPPSLLKLRQHFMALPLLEPLAGGASHAAAGELYARCRWQGITPRSPHDCLIAQIAIDHQCTLLHDDRDFVAITSVEPRLKLFETSVA
jgi:predicted nucleic acid-binding protein